MIVRFFRFLFGKKTVADIGHTVPSNLKFGILVAIALFWADFLRLLLSDFMFYVLSEEAPILTAFLIALVVTALGILVLEGYSRIRKWLEHVEID